MEYYGQSCPCMEKSKRSRRRIGHTNIATPWQMIFDSPFKNEDTSCHKDDHQLSGQGRGHTDDHKGHTFVAYLQSQYSSIPVDLESVTQLEKAGHKAVPTVWKDLLDSPISMEELKAAVNKGASNKAPRRDRKSLEFFKTNWDRIKDDMLALFNQMYRDGKILEQQKYGTVVFIP